jgi:hypothetical protein
LPVSPALSPSDSRKIPANFLAIFFQSGAVNLPLSGNEGRYNSARFMGARECHRGKHCRCCTATRRWTSILAASRLYLSAECRAGTSPALSAHFSTGDRIQHRTHSCWLASNLQSPAKCGRKSGGAS